MPTPMITLKHQTQLKVLGYLENMQPDKNQPRNLYM